MDTRIIEINRLLKEQHDKKYRHPSGEILSYGYDGDKVVPDRVRDNMLARLREILNETPNVK